MDVLPIDHIFLSSSLPFLEIQTSFAAGLAGSLNPPTRMIAIPHRYILNFRLIFFLTSYSSRTQSILEAILKAIF